MRLPKAESEERNRLIASLYSEGLGCRLIAERLGLRPPNVYRRLRRMGLIRTRREASEKTAPDTAPVTCFSQGHAPTNLSRAALGVVLQWFLSRGYMVSLPVDPTYYDLIVESDEGLKKVQVKTTTFRDPASGCWVVNVSRTAYDGESSLNSGGRRKTVSYESSQVDIFFILTSDGSVYLVPLEALGSVKRINLDIKYAKYRHADVVELADTRS